MRTLLPALLLTACTQVTTTPVDTGETADAVAPDTRRPRVLVIGVDGLRADALDQANTPTFDALFPASCRTLKATTHLTGGTLVSGPGWASILTGVEVEDHLVDSNDDLAEISPDWPTFLARAKAAGHPTAAAIHWSGVLLLLGENSTTDATSGDDEAVGTQIAAWVAEPTYDIVFAHFDDVDHAGHASGYGPDHAEYMAAIEGVDTYAAGVLDALAQRSDDDRWMVALVTDHGGVGTGHGPRFPDTETIPVAVCPPTPPGAVLPEAPTHMDVAPSALDWLGVAYDGLDGTSWVPVTR